MKFYAGYIGATERSQILAKCILRVHSQVLNSLHLTFIGLVLIYQKLHQSCTYKIVRKFSAKIISNK